MEDLLKLMELVEIILIMLILKFQQEVLLVSLVYQVVVNQL